MIILIMGVSGSGKTTLGQQLAEILHYEFYDGDDFHPEANIQKMRQNIPLDDADRQPWLLSLQQAIQTWLTQNHNVILACSALKKSYRDKLWQDYSQMQLVYLEGSFELIQYRLQQRCDHFMKAELLQSQFAALEPPETGITVNISQPYSMILQEILAKLK